jgi:hypothetical protein
VLPLDDDLAVVVTRAEADLGQEESPPGIRTFDRGERPFDSEYCFSEGLVDRHW